MRQSKVEDFSTNSSVLFSDAEEVMDLVEKVTIPGAFLVDTLPFCKSSILNSPKMSAFLTSIRLLILDSEAHP